MRVKLVVAAMCLAFVSLAFVSLALSSCGVTTRTGLGSPTDTPSPSPSQTQAAAIPRPTSTQVALRAPCDPSIPGLRSGDLLIYSTYAGWQTYPAAFAGLAYPHMHIPDGTPLTPLQIQYAGSTSGTALSPDPPTNPVMREHAGGYAFAICNLSPTQSHNVQSVSVQIHSMTPYTGTLSQWDFCESAFDTSSHHVTGGGCGGAYWAGEYLHASFAANATTGATVATTQVSSGRDDGLDGYPFGPLPVALKPGDTLPINVGMTVPTMPGTYAFTFQIVVDSITIPASAPATLFAPVAHEWTGQACTSPSIQSQIPAASTPTYYICPAS
jgi:hypothetical protein